MELGAIYQGTVAGRVEEVPRLVTQALAQGAEPLGIVSQYLSPAMSEVGDRFERGEFFLPEMLAAAETMKRAMKVLKPFLREGELESLGTVVAGSVQGDLHDIGKNLVCMMLEGAGFAIVDLGVDVSAQTFLRAIEREKPDLLVMSALISSTKKNMGDMVREISRAEPRRRVKIMVGGAPITQEYSDQIGADGYAPDASAAVRKAKELIGDA